MKRKTSAVVLIKSNDSRAMRSRIFITEVLWASFHYELGIGLWFANVIVINIDHKPDNCNFQKEPLYEKILTWNHWIVLSSIFKIKLLWPWLYFKTIDNYLIKSRWKQKLKESGKFLKQMIRYLFNIIYIYIYTTRICSTIILLTVGNDKHNKGLTILFQHHFIIKTNYEIREVEKHYVILSRGMNPPSTINLRQNE